MLGKLKSAAPADALVMFASAAHAAILTDNLGEVSIDGGPAFPAPEQIDGTFNFATPLGGAVASASVAGTSGNSAFSESTSAFELFADGELIGG